MLCPVDKTKMSMLASQENTDSVLLVWKIFLNFFQPGVKTEVAEIKYPVLGD